MFRKLAAPYSHVAYFRQRLGGIVLTPKGSPKNKLKRLSHLIYSAPTVAAPPDGRRTSQHNGISNITSQPEK